MTPGVCIGVAPHHYHGLGQHTAPHIVAWGNSGRIVLLQIKTRFAWEIRRLILQRPCPSLTIWALPFASY